MIDEILRGYKVVRLTRGRLYSAFVTPALLYPIGEWVRPDLHCGPLALFTDRCFADEFAHKLSIRTFDERGNRIFVSVRPCEWTKWGGGVFFRGSEQHKFWMLKHKGTWREKMVSDGYIRSLPTGTKFASSIRIIPSSSKLDAFMLEEQGMK